MHASGYRLWHGEAPRSFAGLMAVYESNYRRLMLLAPGLDGLERAVSRVPGCLDLHLRVLERHRYTTFLHLTYWFEQPDGGVRPDPDLHIRMYHDARLAEVHSCLRPQRRGGEADGCSLARRWQMNRFLEKWLAYCLAQGHGFPPAGRTVAGESAFGRAADPAVP